MITGVAGKQTRISVWAEIAFRPGTGGLFLAENKLLGRVFG
jgi:hypothetical protein